MGLIAELPKYKSTKWPWGQETPVELYKEHEQWPKISIVTPSYNQGIFLEETLRSVLLQNYPNLEYIVMDGGSKDKSLPIIKKYAPWLTHWVSEKDEGQSDAINKGLVLCNGEIFNWINSDDLYLPGALYKVGKAYIKNKFDVFAAYSHHFNGSYENICLKNDRVPLSKTIEETIAYRWYSQIGTFYRTDIFKHFNGVNVDKKYVMDIDLWLKYLLAKGNQKKVVLSDEVVALFRIHDLSKTGSGLEKFEIETASMMRNITRQCGAPDFFLNEQERRNRRSLWYHEEVQISPKINKALLVGIYYRRYPEYFYENKDYPALKKSLLFMFKTSLGFYTKRNLALAIKAFLIPRSLLDYIRTRKNSSYYSPEV